MNTGGMEKLPVHRELAVNASDRRAKVTLRSVTEEENKARKDGKERELKAKALALFPDCHINPVFWAFKDAQRTRGT